MHNRVGFNRLGRKSSHRKALHRNMVTSLIKYERIKTTKAKAREIRRTAEKLVTRGKTDTVHNRRLAARIIYEKAALNKLFTEIGPRFADRPGGYTRIVKLGYRKGDAAEMVILEFLGEDEKPAGKKKPAKKKAQTKPAEVKKPAEEVKAEEPETGKTESEPEKEIKPEEQKDNQE